MPYASLVPSQEEEPRIHTFMQRSHKRRGRAKRKRLSKMGHNRRARVHLKHIDEVATIQCEFCHQLFTLCEDAQLFPDSPYTQHQYRLLYEQEPVFVAMFILETIDFDWAAQRAKTVEKMSKKAKNRKRKRDESDGDETGDEEVTRRKEKKKEKKRAKKKAKKEKKEEETMRAQHV